MLLVFAVVAEEFESSVSFLKSNSDCLYFCVSDFHSAADLVLSGLIDSVMVDLLSLCSLVHPTEASILLIVKRCSFLLLYAVPSCKKYGTFAESNSVLSCIGIGSNRDLSSFPSRRSSDQLAA